MIPYLEKTFETKRNLVEFLLKLKSEFPNANSLEDLPEFDKIKYRMIMNDFFIPVGQGYALRTLKFYLLHPIKSVRAKKYQEQIDKSVRISEY